MKYKGKRLVILGGNPETIELVNKAKDNGIFTIVVDPNPNSPAKREANLGVDIDGLDTKAIITYLKRNPVDGILVGVADILVKSYHEVGKELNFPIYTNQEIVEVFSYKNKFKSKLIEFGLNGIPEFNYPLDHMVYPVMVKPVDNGGGVGISSAQNEFELEQAINIALQNSKSKKYIIEKFMNSDDCGIYLTIQDGEIFTSLVYDRFTTKDQVGKSNVCLGGIYPSKYLNLYLSKVELKLTKMLKALNVKNGVLMLSAFIEKKEFYFYDVGFRLQGEAPQIILKNINQFDQVQMLIDFAMTGKFGEQNLSKFNDIRLHNNYAATIWFLGKEGVINKIEGIEEIKNLKRVIEVRQRLFENDSITRYMIGNEKQVIFRVYIKGENKEKLVETYNQVIHTLKVLDNNNNSMIIKNFKIEGKI
jgi:formate-dependent phosphoribosylglycinamide formyltransferase (GAR transformylase)